MDLSRSWFPAKPAFVFDPPAVVMDPSLVSPELAVQPDQNIESSSEAFEDLCPSPSSSGEVVNAPPRLSATRIFTISAQGAGEQTWGL